MSALNDFETASIVKERLCPNKHFFGCKSTDLEVEITAQTETVQSAPAVMRVFESAKSAHES